MWDLIKIIFIFLIKLTTHSSVHHFLMIIASFYEILLRKSNTDSVLMHISFYSIPFEVYLTIYAVGINGS